MGLAVSPCTHWLPAGGTCPDSSGHAGAGPVTCKLLTDIKLSVTLPKIKIVGAAGGVQQ